MQYTLRADFFHHCTTNVVKLEWNGNAIVALISMIVSLTAAILATSKSLNYAFFFTRIFVCTNLAWTTESVFLDIRTRSSFANASLVTRENSAKQVIMWPANADIFCLCMRHKEYFSGRNIVEIRQRLRLSYTESPAGNLEPYHGPIASRSFEVVGKAKVYPTRKWRTSERFLLRNNQRCQG